MIVRMANEHDIPAIAHFAELLHGKLNSLPMDKAVIAHKIKRSCVSLTKKIVSPGSELYFFVLENLATKHVVGCAAIEACVGLTQPFYTYRISQLEHISPTLNYRQTVKLLELNTDLNKTTELCSLYLLPDYREKNNGKLLSLSRLLFMTNFPERFTDRVFADIRGFSIKKHQPSFWQHVIKHFMPFDFAEADKLTGLEQRQFISDLMPKFPLYIDLLPTDAQAVIGRPHPKAMPAKKMLEDEGFHSHDYVNIFDAGPTLTAFRNNIKTINEVRLVKIKKVDATLNNDMKHYLLATTTLDFRATVDNAIIEENEHIIITPRTADALKVGVNDCLLYRTMN
ncbi:MAG: arginine N-succinyltransferase [Gammaproteobacteria bacterium]|nr:arginine N-succinyltransferase [Gammaproteobacteria bacterium]